ncbi:altered inheritance of mitochondria protein 31, mitochondrial [Dothidotthia symphoricarpi CBS 119687]|uniref:Altered inheritance of mitochondria protein 31, mitochondrial n=1 Tax=Dothidotthia symphoricarpi CBS 119687 TaxID=1392245 RepID=A0A6A6AMR5_9PLEO|nr:altered inheritance of mitochondria protein 31, mitochondrial [Dothidotthia symphoricarpi CBS 119687]KAF2132177.1 altered inheritance of mitochondria protein 31, mitochondrial [Dothidotthia symphoricarpi CBS 119687]
MATGPGPRNTAPLPSSFDENADFYNENTIDKIWRRFREEPLVPLGCGLTVWAIVGATRSMRQGDHKMTNMYFRRRLYAQAFTIAVLVAGNLYWKKDRMKRKDYEKMVAEKDRMDKRGRWLKELEMRDEEDKAWKDRMAKRTRGATEEAKGVTDLVAEKTKELKDQVVNGK